MNDESRFTGRADYACPSLECNDFEKMSPMRFYIMAVVAKKKGEDDVVVVKPDFIYAKNYETAQAIVSKRIPDEYMDQGWELNIRFLEF